MITLLSDHYVLQPVTVGDLELASLAWGFTIGFGFLTTWTAIRQTADIYKRYGHMKLNSPYVVMIWLEILVCLIFSIICWLHLNAVIPPSFAFYFVILTTWALQVQFLLQIIINRVSILLMDRQKAIRLKIGVAILITSINISVYCIWVPARLQISTRYEQINNVWDRCEKTIYLLVDAALNYYFIRIVKRKLVNQGLVKYNKLVRFNMWIICFSLGMDLLIISMMSLKNSFVYMQFHPLAYMVKLNIEMSMADLIAKVSRMDINHKDTSYLRSQDPHFGTSTHHNPGGNPGGHANGHHGVLTQAYHSSEPAKVIQDNESVASSGLELEDITHGSRRHGHSNFEINVKSEVQVQIEERGSMGGSTKDGSFVGNAMSSTEDDTKPLREEDMERDAAQTVYKN